MTRVFDELAVKLIWFVFATAVHELPLMADVAVVRAARKVVGVGYDPGVTVYVPEPIVIVL
jgi:hypothetical protein